MRKIFVLDTNVILHNADALNVFADNEVILPIDVIEELDIFKKDSDEKGRNARAAMKNRAMNRRLFAPSFCVIDDMRYSSPVPGRSGAG